MVRLECVITTNWRLRGHLFQQPGEAIDVRLVERRVHLVQDAKRAWLVFEDGHQQGHGRERALAARKQRTLCSFLPGGEATMSMPDSIAFSTSFRRISPMPPPNSVRNMPRKFSLMAFEGFGEALAGLDVDLGYGLLGVADGVEQVLPLSVEKIVPLLGLVELLHRFGVDRAQGVDLAAEFLALLFDFRQTYFVEDRFVAFRNLLQRAAELLVAGLLEILELGLLLHEVEFHLRAPIRCSLQFLA
jgi:hypothetical protein